MLVTWWGFPGGASGKEPACQCRRHERPRFDAWVRKIPWRRTWQPTPVFLPGDSHEQRSLVGYRPRGRKEPDTTEAIKPTRMRGNPHTHTLHPLTPEVGRAEPPLQIRVSRAACPPGEGGHQNRAQAPPASVSSRNVPGPAHPLGCLCDHRPEHGRPGLPPGSHPAPRLSG